MSVTPKSVARPSTQVSSGPRPFLSRWSVTRLKDPLRMPPNGISHSAGVDADDVGQPFLAVTLTRIGARMHERVQEIEDHDLDLRCAGAPALVESPTIRSGVQIL